MTCLKCEELQHELETLRKFKANIEAKQAKAIAKVNNDPFTYDFWIVDGDTKTYDVKEELKNQGARWNSEFKCWNISLSKDTLEDMKDFFRTIGVKLQAK